MEKTSSNTGKLVGALVIGAAVGATLGILFAPNKGAETRKKLLSRGGDFSEAIKDKFNGLVANAKKDVEKVSSKSNSILEHKNA